MSFFQVRVAGLRDQLAARLRATSPDGRSAGAQLRAIRERTLQLVDRHSRLFSESIHLALKRERHRSRRLPDARGIRPRRAPPCVRARALSRPDAALGGPGPSLPYISNLSLSLAVRVEDGLTGEYRFARVKVPPLLPRFVPLSDQVRLVSLEQVIAEKSAFAVPEHVRSERTIASA